jgi:hypothetical protein
MPDIILRKKRGPKPKWTKERETRRGFLKARIDHHLEALRFTLRAYSELIGDEEKSQRGGES